MTPRENFLSLLRRQGYEYAPVQLEFCPSLIERFHAEIGEGINYEEYFHHPYQHVAGQWWGGSDRDWSSYYPEGFGAGTTFSHWGVGAEPGSAEAMHMHRMLHPLLNAETLEDIENYPYPDMASADTSKMAGEVAAVHARGLASMVSMACTIWETAWYMRGMEPLMMDMLGEDDMATVLFDKITDRACICAAFAATAGVDIVFLGDDVGMQHNLMMAPELYRTWIKPRLARVIAAAKDIKPDVIIAYHSCGYVTPLIGDLMEAGVEVLNPVQPECMDFADLHTEFGDRLSFWGSVGTQTTMPFGTPAEVAAVVKRNLDIAGPQGGLYCTPTHLLEPEVPWENILAYVEACGEYNVRK